MNLPFKRPQSLPLRTHRTYIHANGPTTGGYHLHFGRSCGTCIKQLVLLFVFVFSSCTSHEDARIVEINEVLSSLHREQKFNGTVLIAEKGAILYEKSFGFADHQKKIPFSENSVFNVASISKTMTGVAIMQLVEGGRLKLNDRIVKYFPQIPYENVTVRNLLTHTSGFPRIQSQPFLGIIQGKGLTNEELKDTFIKTAPKLRFAPGTDFFYANTNYILLALIIEKVSGADFNQYLTRHIFERCDMQQTFLKKWRVPDWMQADIVRYYRKPYWLSNRFHLADTLKENRMEERTFGKHYGPSDIHTTARNLLKFHNALMNGTLLKEASLRKMYSPYHLTNGKAYAVNSKSNYPAQSGLTWRIAADSTAGKIVFHSGGLRGGRSHYMRNVTEDQCVIILTNNEEVNRYTFTFPMRVLNNAAYKLDKISLASTISEEYLKNGMDAALEKHALYEKDEHYAAMVDFDFEEIGEELIAAKDYEAAVALYQLYTIKFPDEYAWTVLGEAYLLNAQPKKALNCFEKALELNPEHKDAKDALDRIHLEE